LRLFQSFATEIQAILHTPQRLAGWSMSATMTAKLVVDALMMSFGEGETTLMR